LLHWMLVEDKIFEGTIFVTICVLYSPFQRSNAISPFSLTVICPITDQDRPLGLQDVQASRISLTLSCVLSPGTAVFFKVSLGYVLFFV
jgi:hypothetical protein